MEMALELEDVQDLWIGGFMNGCLLNSISGRWTKNSAK